MQILGHRHDGCLLLSIGGGVGVILRGQYASKPMDLVTLSESMGPWSPSANTLDERRDAQRLLDRSRMMPISNFVNLANSDAARKAWESRRANGESKASEVKSALAKVDRADASLAGAQKRMADAKASGDPAARDAAIAHAKDVLAKFKASRKRK